MKFRAILVPLAAIAAAVAMLALPASAAPANHHHGVYCPKPIRLRHPESLAQLHRQFPWTPAELLSEATMCWGFRRPTWNGWTPNLSRLLDGQYGKDELSAKLPAGTRIWLP